MEYGIKNKDLSREYAEDVELATMAKNQAFISNMEDMMKMITDSMNYGAHSAVETIKSVKITNSQTGMQVKVETTRQVFIPRRY